MILFFIIFFSIIPLAHGVSLSEFVAKGSIISTTSVPLTSKSQQTQISEDGKAFLRAARAQSGDDPSCSKLKNEYDQVCFALPPAAAFVETKAFCDAFVETCGNTLKNNVFTNLGEIEIDFTAYCKKNKERFRYVCPDPIRFHTFADDALAFCSRYIERCPKEELPGEPVPFKDPNAGHIYIREVEALCKPMRRIARNYCTDPDLIKVPKYAIPCYFFKVNCIDVYRKVIYG